MQGHSNSLRRMPLFLIVFGLVSIVCAQTGSSLLRTRSVGNTTSQRFLTLKFVLPDGNWIRATQREGGVIRVEKRAAVYVFAVGLVDGDNPSISVQVSQDIGINAIRGVEPIRFYRTLAEFRSTKPPFIIQVEGIRSVSKAESRSMIGEGLGLSDAGTCCVTCDLVKTCACAVEASCGSCCMGACCN